MMTVYKQIWTERETSKVKALEDYDHGFIIREVVLNLMSNSSGKPQMKQELSLQPNLQKHPDFIGLVNCEKKMVQWIHQSRCLYGDLILALNRQGTSMSSETDPEKFFNFIVRHILTNKLWEEHKWKTMSIFFYFAVNVASALKGVNKTVNDLLPTFTALLNAIYSKLTWDNETKKLIEKYWLPVNELKHRNCTEEERRIERQHTLNLELVEKRGIQRRLTSVMSFTSILATNILEEKNFKLPFEEVTREFIVHVICTLDSRPQEIREQLSWIPRIDELYHYEPIFRYLYDVASNEDYMVHLLQKYIDSTEDLMLCFNMLKLSPGHRFLSELKRILIRDVVEPMILSDVHTNWDPMFMMFHYVHSLAETIARDEEMSSRLKIRLYNALADAIYYSLSGINRPNCLESYAKLDVSVKRRSWRPEGRPMFRI